MCFRFYPRTASHTPIETKMRRDKKVERSRRIPSRTEHQGSLRATDTRTHVERQKPRIAHRRLSRPEFAPLNVVELSS